MQGTSINICIKWVETKIIVIYTIYKEGNAKTVAHAVTWMKRLSWLFWARSCVFSCSRVKM